MWRLSATVRHKHSQLYFTETIVCVETMCVLRVLEIRRENLVIGPNVTNVSETCLSLFSETWNKENERDSKHTNHMLSRCHRLHCWTEVWTRQMAAGRQSCSVQIKPPSVLIQTSWLHTVWAGEEAARPNIWAAPRVISVVDTWWGVTLISNELGP